MKQVCFFIIATCSLVLLGMENNHLSSTALLRSTDKKLPNDFIQKRKHPSLENVLKNAGSGSIRRTDGKLFPKGDALGVLIDTVKEGKTK